ncbi:MAG: GFA family protein, partial [Hyphomicrobiaceae bacterium]
GYLLSFAPMTSFRLLAGQDATTDYQFGAKNIHHLFCSTCGVSSYAKGTAPGSNQEMAAVNVRCLDDVDMSAIDIQAFNGKSL